MSKQTKEKPVDIPFQTVMNVLREYKEKHPKAKVDAFRTSKVTMRIRVIDPDFTGKDLVDRDNAVWEFLDKLSDDALQQVTVLTLIAPKEIKGWVNLEYEEHRKASKSSSVNGKLA